MKIYQILFLPFIFISCFNEEEINPENSTYSGSRTLLIDVSKPKAEAKAYGAFMGTPDLEALRDEIQSIKDSGDIENIIEHSKGYEGGATFCFSFTENSNKQMVYENLQRFSTDLKETNYTVISLDRCSNSASNF